MKRIRHLILLIVLLTLPAISVRTGEAQTDSNTLCRYGIGAPNGTSGYDLSLIGVGSYLTWGATPSSKVADTVRFLHVLLVSDKSYANTQSTLPAVVAANPGGIWIIGNEPDAEVTYQDHLTPEVYALRYFTLATQIRTLDPTARIAFGTIIQPTELRLYYLDQTLQELDSYTKSRSATAALIDIVSIHAFILNEEPIYDANGVAMNWGAGVPPGYVAGTWPDPYVIYIGGPDDETWKTHNIGIFSQRLIRFREWMKSSSLQDKPLWITEYGSLFPSVGSDYLTVSESDTADYLQQTMDFMLSAKNTTTGYAQDSYRLVQNFVWYSLNENLQRFGGSLYDPTTKALTLVGQRFLDYDPPPTAGLPYLTADLAVTPGNFGIFPIGLGSSPNTVRYRIRMRASNANASVYHTLAALSASADGTTLGARTLTLPRCGGQGIYEFTFEGQPGSTHSFTGSVSLGVGDQHGADANSSNDSFTFNNIVLPDIYQIHMPIVHRSP